MKRRLIAGMATDIIENPDFKTDEAILFLHGLPGLFTHHHDSAYRLAFTLKQNCYLPYFPGIGASEGAFSFFRCVDAIEQLISEEKLKKVKLFGHSFGGLVSLNLLQRNPDKVSKAALLAPLLKLFPKKESAMLLNYVFTLQNPFRSTSDRTDIDQLMIELEEFRGCVPLENIKLFEPIDKSSCILFHGRSDEVLPLSDSQNFCRHVEWDNFFEFNTDHSFSNVRDQMLAKVVDHFGTGEKLPTP